METLLLVILVVIVIIMIGTVLIQRSEGGGLGIGGPSAMFSARGSANFLTRITAGLAALFMILSLVLAILSGRSDVGGSLMDRAPEEPEPLPLESFQFDGELPEPLPSVPEAEVDSLPPVTLPESDTTSTPDAGPVVPKVE